MDVVWAAMIEPGLPRWSPSFRHMAVRGGGPLRPGAVVDTSVRGRLPFTLDFVLTVTTFEPRSRIEVMSCGDIEGTGTWRLAAREGDTVITYTWDVGLTNRMLDLLGRIPATKRLLAANHDRVMSDAFRSMARDLGSSGD